MNVSTIKKKKLLLVGKKVKIHEGVIFLPHDQMGNAKPIKLGNNVRIMSGAIIYGSVTVGDNVVIESQVILGQPEYGYAIGKVYPGEFKETVISDDVVLRAGAIIYSGVRIGEKTTIGHRTLVRTETVIGNNSQLGHNMTIERNCRIGDWVRCTGLTHITSSTVLEDRVFLGALVGTVNDKSMIWKQEDLEPELIPPYFEYGCTVGTGAKIAAGVRIGRMAMVGTGSVVTKNVAPNTIVMGVPAKFYKNREES
ncbi:MAG: hypothetical protein A3D35_02505 [Candidatus Staskawiczbacteria bacterium RIFCSPHIGHO2_02_FULL_34_9]|uniref:Transferase n=1 Tax=Candidatus Staskawiczbacteria bacterium RIFCSPHIGHO2_02_FULL_34_9 TaxID=1802206 RepID=A0A1G2HYH1_9BACT|nr:MAG: hypothetical protein A3D35_02505 [Candidatus Staskawiczbacteria bacterium RIFCSPHIGHO2_02_FULL_34_9]